MNKGFTSHLSELGEFTELQDSLKKGGMYELSGILDVAKGQIVDALGSDCGRKLVVFASEKTADAPGGNPKATGKTGGTGIYPGSGGSLFQGIEG